MRNLPKAQKSLFFNLQRGLQLFLLGFCFTQPGFSLTLEAEQVLNALREKNSTGLIDEGLYTDFLSDLDEKDDCDSWANDSLSVASEVWEEILLVCPELQSSRNHFRRAERRGGHGALEVVALNHPRMDSLSLPAFKGEGANQFASGIVDLRGQELFHRVFELHHNSVSLTAGHVYTNLSDTRLKFITGRKFYAGYKGSSGISGPLASPRSALDGLLLSWNWNHWTAQLSGAWNQIEPNRDAAYHALGISHGGSRFYLAHEKLESMSQSDLEVSLLGMATQEKDNLWHAGAAISQRVGITTKYGAYAEAGWRKNLEIYQSTPGWTSPLQSRRGNLQDTVDGTWIMRGAGEGGLQLKTSLPMWETNAYVAKLENGNQLSWTTVNPSLLSARSRLTLVQCWHAFTYSIGSGIELRRSKSVSEETEFLETVKGFGQILAWQGKAWRIKASLVLQSEDYQGPYPQPFALSIKHFMGARQYVDLDLLTGELRQPTRYLRLIVKQAWELGNGVGIRHAIRLPYAEASGWSNDLGYQVGIQTRF